MDVGTFCTQSHVLVVAGKGGVGKTTMTAAIARMASGTGRAVLIVELEGKSGITGAFGLAEDLGYDEVELQPASPGTGPVRARRITPDDALVEYLEDHGLKRVSKRLVSSGVVDVVSTAIPGIRDVLVLGKVKQLERDQAADLIVVRDDLRAYVAAALGDPDGVLIGDDTGFEKGGSRSAGVQRQYTGTAGKITNCQLGVFLAYASAKGRALVDRELYLPRSWTGDSQRMAAAGVPGSTGFRTKPQLFQLMIERAVGVVMGRRHLGAVAAFNEIRRTARSAERRVVDVATDLLADFPEHP